MTSPSELFDVQEKDGRWYVLTQIREPGEPIYMRDALGIRNVIGYEERSERWEPLATFIVHHRALTFPTEDVVVSSISLADALIAEGWTAPWKP